MSEPTAEHVTVLETPAGKRIYLIGTAHVSQSSVDEVEALIDKVRPQTVCIELCPTRYQALTDPQRWQKLDIFKVIREGKTLFLLANLAMVAYQRRLGDRLGVKPGSEMLAAARKAEALGAQVVLADRDIQITLKRTWRSLTLRRKAEIIAALFSSLGSREEISAEQVEALKQKAQLSEMMRELATAMPDVQRPLIDERDQYLMSRIAEAPGDRVVAVVGAGHVEGMTQYFGATIDRAALETLPPPSRWVTALKWLFPLLILAAFGLASFKQEGRTLQQMILAWVLPTSLGAGLLTLAAGGKLLSFVAAVLGAPITTLHPMIGAGMIVGLVEAWLRRPTVDDAERLDRDIQSLRGVYANPFTRVLLVATLSSLGAAAGAWVGASWVLSLLA